MLSRWAIVTRTTSTTSKQRIRSTACIASKYAEVAASNRAQRGPGHARVLALYAATSLLQAKAKHGPAIYFCSRNPELGTNQLTKCHDIREEQVEQNSDQNQIDQEDKRPGHIVPDNCALVPYESAGGHTNTCRLRCYGLADLSSYRVQRRQKKRRES